MTIRNWQDARVTPDASVLLNNPRHVITWLVPAGGKLVDRRTISPPPGKVRISDLPMRPEVNCLRTIQFVHHAFIPPGQLHAPEGHLHPDAEEVFYIVAGQGEFRLDDERHPVSSGDCVHLAPGVYHELRNTGAEPLEFVDFCVPVGAALRKLTDPGDDEGGG
jgi:mannose-6-phosphate isomerase-like protein (cupin superfamily)